MTRSSLSKMVRGASKDIISDMPNNVINIILESLPIRDAVKTSILSRKWQYRWTTISELVFDAQFFTSLSIKFLSDLQLKDIINKLLLLHIGPIPKFTLYFVPEIRPLKFDLRQWLLFLSRNGIKELTVHYSCFGFHHRLGFQLYSCHELTHLSLRHCTLNRRPAAFEGFPNLTTLELHSVISSDLKFETILSSCPLLEKLSMERCLGIGKRIVPPPNVKYLHVKEVVDLKTICLNSAMKVTTLSISVHSTSLPGQPRKMEKLLFGNYIIEFFVAGGVPKRLPIALDNLKKMVFFEIDFNDVANISCALCLIRSSPNLSELKITGLHHSNSAIIQDPNFMEDDRDRDCSLGQLRIVKLKYAKVLKTEMAIIKFLLAHSPLLEKMYIQPKKGIHKDVSFAMCKELTQFGRASPKAAVIYEDRSR